MRLPRPATPPFPPPLSNPCSLRPRAFLPSTLRSFYFVFLHRSPYSPHPIHSFTTLLLLAGLPTPLRRTT